MRFSDSLTRVMAIMMVAVMAITMLCISGVSIVKAANGGTREAKHST